MKTKCSDRKMYMRDSFNAICIQEGSVCKDCVIETNGIVFISGYWKDTNEIFEGYKCKTTLDVSDDDDFEDTIFYYFDGVNEVKDYMNKDFKGLEFVITKYYGEE